MRLGTDIIEIARIQQAYQKRPQFAERVLSEAEMALFNQYPEKRAIEFLAGRFSAKEAYGKALQTGVGTWLRFNEISILPNESGAPVIVKGPIIEHVSVSISHSQHYATATVIIDQLEKDIQTQLSIYKKEDANDATE